MNNTSVSFRMCIFLCFLSELILLLRFISIEIDSLWLWIDGFETHVCVFLALEHSLSLLAFLDKLEDKFWNFASSWSSWVVRLRSSSILGLFTIIELLIFGLNSFFLQSSSFFSLCFPFLLLGFTLLPSNIFHCLSFLPLLLPLLKR